MKHTYCENLMPSSSRFSLNRLALCVLFLFTSCLMLSCLPSEEKKGVVATVNNVPIYLFSLETQRNMLFAGLDRSGRPPSDDVLKVEYAYALKQLIVQELVRQYLEEKELLPDKNDLQGEIDEVTNDYGAELSRTLMENGDSIDLWHDAMMRQLVVNRFLDKVLKPTITIKSDEIEKYYRSHMDDFIVPEQWHFAEISGMDKEQVENAQSDLLASQNATAVQVKYEVRIRDVLMGKDRLPESVFKEIAGLSPMKAGPVTINEEGFFTRILFGVSQAKPLETLQMYKRIESALIEDRLASSFNEWIKNQLKKAKIQIAKDLIPFEPLEDLEVIKALKNTKNGNGTDVIDDNLEVSHD